MSFIDTNFIYTKTSTIKYIKIEVFQMILFDSCSFNIFLYDENKNIIEMKFIKLEDENYKLWANDDEFILNFIKKELNIL